MKVADWSVMDRNKGRQYSDQIAPAAIEDSPSIKKLIEQIGQDPEENVRNTSKQGQSTSAA